MKEFECKAFANRIKELTIEKGCTQLDLARYVGVKPNTVSDWIRKGNSPKLIHIEKITKFFGVSYDYLFTGENNITRQDSTYDLDRDEQLLIEKFRSLPNERAKLMFLGIAEDKLNEFIDEYSDNSKSNETQKNVG